MSAPPPAPLTSPLLVVNAEGTSTLCAGGDFPAERQSVSPAFYSPGPENARSSNEKMLSNKLDKLSTMLAAFSNSQKNTNDDLFRELKSLSRSNEHIIHFNK